MYYIYYLEFYSISIEQILQPCLLLNSLDHNNYIPRMWSVLMWTTPLTSKNTQWEAWKDWVGRPMPFTKRMSIPHPKQLRQTSSMRSKGGHWFGELVAFAEQLLWETAEKWGQPWITDCHVVQSEVITQKASGSGCTEWRKSTAIPATLGYSRLVAAQWSEHEGAQVHTCQYIDIWTLLVININKSQ